jgi:hypothetical protein
METLNDKEQSNQDARQRAPGRVATCDPEASNNEAHLRNLAKNTPALLAPTLLTSDAEE